MGILIAVIIAAGAAFGTAKKDGVLEKGYDTTYKDTVAFEYNAARLTQDSARAKAERLEVVMESWGPADEETAKAAPQHEPGI